MRRTLGQLLNWLGWPGLVREAEYHGRGTTALVRVKNSRLFTVVSVNGTDVYFDRLTGRIDGTGTSQSADLPAVPIAQSTRPAELRADATTQTQSKTR